VVVSSQCEPDLSVILDLESSFDPCPAIVRKLKGDRRAVYSKPPGAVEQQIATLPDPDRFDTPETEANGIRICARPNGEVILQRSVGGSVERQGDAGGV